MREVATTLLDALGLVLVAAGTGCQIFGWVYLWVMGPDGFEWVALGAGLLAAGVILLVGSWLADRMSRRGEA